MKSFQNLCFFKYEISKFKRVAIKLYSFFIIIFFMFSFWDFLSSCSWLILPNWNVYALIGPDPLHTLSPHRISNSFSAFEKFANFSAWSVGDSTLSLTIVCIKPFPTFLLPTTSLHRIGNPLQSWIVPFSLIYRSLF